MVNKSGKIEELESLRGLAALLVVFFHIPKWNAWCHIGIVDNGSLVVWSFFVLSGFVIFNAYLHTITTFRELVRFQFLRLGRLYPVHALFLLVFLLIESLKYIAELKFGIHSPNSVPFQTNNLEAFLKNILLIQAVLPDQPLTFNYPSWSISVEFYTYLVFALAVLFFRRFSLIFFGVVTVTSLGMLAKGSTFGFDHLLHGLAGFFLGCLTAAAVRSCKRTVPRALSTVVFLALVLFLQFKPTDYGTMDGAIYFLTVLLIATLVLSPEGRLNQVLKHASLVWLGTISYSLYMSHAAVEWAVNQAIRLILKRPEMISPEGQSIPQLSAMEAAAAYGIVVFAVLVVSAVVYQYVEKPMREKSRRIAGK